MKTGLSGRGLLFTIVGLALLAAQYNLFITPLLAGHGGQWAAGKQGYGGFGDLHFYPQSKAYPFTTIAYVIGLIIILVLAIPQYKLKHWRSLFKLYIVAALLPTAWMISSFIAGFNYAKCHIPSANYSCSNPVHQLTHSLYIGALITILSVLWVKLAKKVYFGSQKTLAGRDVS